MFEVREKILKILRDHPEINVDSLDLDADFRGDLGLDSLVIAEIVIEIEDQFNIQFPRRQFSRFKK